MKTKTLILDIQKLKKFLAHVVIGVLAGMKEGVLEFIRIF